MAETSVAPRGTQDRQRILLLLIPLVIPLTAAFVALAIAVFQIFVAPQINTLRVLGNDDLRGWSSEAQPLVLKLASLSNSSTSDMEILGVTEDGHVLSDVVLFGITRDGAENPTTSEIEWLSGDNPVTVESDETVWLWTSIAIEEGNPEGFQWLQVHYRDQVPWERTANVYVRVMAVPEDLPAGVDSFDGQIDSVDFSEYLDAFVLAMEEGDPSTVASFLGPDASRSDAEQFLEAQREIDAEAGYMWSRASDTTAEVQFSRHGYDDLGPAFVITWTHNRWFVLPESRG